MIYLDSAATTLQKPASVRRAVAYGISHFASPGRGGHLPSRRAGELLFCCRETAAQLFDVPSPEQVVLTTSATHGLNIAIRSLAFPGATVLISGYEHNAVYRTLSGMEGVRIKIASAPVFDSQAIYQAFEDEMTDEVDLVICNHVSNVFGFILPVERIANLCARRGKPLIVDASQSAGILPVQLRRWKAAFIAMPGHKSLYGPQGTGLLLCGEQVNPNPLLYGGTGSISLDRQMPEFLPDRLEAGTQNVCGAAGLLAGMRFLQRIGIGNIARHEQRLCKMMSAELRCLPNVQVFSGPEQAGVLSFVPRNSDCEAIGETLGQKGIAVRAGLHCAPLAHRSAGTLETGTVRASFSVFNRPEEVLYAAKQIARLVS